MSRYDDDLRGGNRPPSGPGPNEAYRVGPGARGRDLHDPYEGRRETPTFTGDRAWAAEHPWQAAHPSGWQGQPAPDWDEQPARYGGGYRGDDDRQWSDRRLDTAGFGGRHDPRRHGFDRPYSHHGSYGSSQSTDAGGQTNSGYDANRAYGEGRRGGAGGGPGRQADDDAGARGAPARGWHGAQLGRPDTHGSAGWQQEGKRYWFDENDTGSFRGVGPRGYQRSDERLRELICERLTDADLDASDIEVSVHEGVVTLDGSVRARWMKHQAEDLVDDCGGVKDIHNQLRVQGRQRPTGGQQDTGTAAEHPDEGPARPH